ncbi:MAG: TlpA family protein disulfide reductase [Terriglobales bacterium]
MAAARDLGLIPGRAKLILFVFFAPSDCPACLRESAIWQQGAVEIRNLAVIGVMDRAEPGAARFFLGGAGIRFPVLLNPGSALRNAFGLRLTPEKLLVDRSGNVILSSPPDRTIADQVDFARRLRAACGAAEFARP